MPDTTVKTTEFILYCVKTLIQNLLPHLSPYLQAEKGSPDGKEAGRDAPFAQSYRTNHSPHSFLPYPPLFPHWPKKKSPSSWAKLHPKINYFKKINNFDIHYSLQGVNQRLNKLIQDPIFTSYLPFVKWLSYNFIDLISCDMMLNRFCLQILPSIHHKIEWLDLESLTMERILLSTDYPNLSALGLYDLAPEAAIDVFSDKIFSSTEEILTND